MTGRHDLLYNMYNIYYITWHIVGHVTGINEFYFSFIIVHYFCSKLIVEKVIVENLYMNIQILEALIVLLTFNTLGQIVSQLKQMFSPLKLLMTRLRVLKWVFSIKYYLILILHIIYKAYLFSFLVNKTSKPLRAFI